VKFFRKNGNHIFPFFIFIFALFIRLWNFSDVEFKLDEALAIFKASQFWFTGQLPLAGLISSTLAANSPLFIYLLMPLTLISSNPLFVTFFFVLGGSFTVLLTYQLLKKYSPVWALFSAGLFATSAWPILFSRKIWAQNFLPLFSVLILYFADRLYNKKNKKVILSLIILSLWAFQIHFSGFLVIPFVLLVLILTKVKIEAKTVVLGLLFGLLPFLPYLIRQFQNGFADFILLFGSQTQGYFDIHSFTSPFRIVAGFYFARVLQADYLEFIQSIPLGKFVFVIFNLQSLLVILGFLIALSKGKKFLLLNLFFGLMLITSFLSRRPALPFYEELFFPLIFAFAGLCLWQIFQIKKWGRLISGFIFIACLSANLVFIFSFYSFVHLKEQINGDYGLVFRKKEDLVQKSIKDYPNHQTKQKLTVALRVIYSISNFDKKENKYLPQKELVPIVNKELINFKFGD